MADEEVLFDDVYELCEIIGKWVRSPRWNRVKIHCIDIAPLRYKFSLTITSVADILNKFVY